MELTVLRLQLLKGTRSAGAEPDVAGPDQHLGLSPGHAGYLAPCDGLGEDVLLEASHHLQLQPVRLLVLDDVGIALVAGLLVEHVVGPVVRYISLRQIGVQDRTTLPLELETGLGLGSGLGHILVLVLLLGRIRVRGVRDQVRHVRRLGARV